MRVTELVAKSLESRGLLEGCEILALEVLDEGDLERATVVNVDLHARDLAQSCNHRSLVASLPCDDLESFPMRSHQDGLEDTLLLDGGDEIGQVSELTPWLMGIRLELVDVDETADGSMPSARDLLDEVGVVPHSLVERQSCFSRHGQGPLLRVCNTRALRSSWERR